MRIAAAQPDQTAGDFRGNADRIIAAARKAAAQGARVLLGPELSLTRYRPEDLLLRKGFKARNDPPLAELGAACASFDPAVLVGRVAPPDPLEFDARARRPATAFNATPRSPT